MERNVLRLTATAEPAYKLPLHTPPLICFGDLHRILRAILYRIVETWFLYSAPRGHSMGPKEQKDKENKRQESDHYLGRLLAFTACGDQHGHCSDNIYTGYLPHERI